MSSPITSPKQDRFFAIITGSFVALAFAIIVGMVIRHPFDHSECPIYLRASWDWWAGRGLYDKNFGIDGYLYFPQFAVLYSPFALIDPILKYPVGNQPIQILAIGDCLWRAAGLIVLLVGLWRLAGLFAPQHRLALFNLLTWMSFLPAIASLRNGQANLHIAALMLLTAVELPGKNWSRATLWLVLGFLIKPVMAVMILLAAVRYPKMIVRLIIGLAAGFLLPFAFQNPHYVSSQYTVFIHFTFAAAASGREFCNLHGMLSKFGCHIPLVPYQFIALLAAGATLGLWLLASRRNEPARSFFLFALSACYILLFNFRTESSAYVIVAPAIGLATAMALFRFHNLVVGWFLIALSFCLICDAWAFHLTTNWLKPLVCLIFFVMLAVKILRKSRTESEPEKTESLVGA